MHTSPRCSNTDGCCLLCTPVVCFAPGVLLEPLGAEGRGTAPCNDITTTPMGQQKCLHTETIQAGLSFPEETMQPTAHVVHRCMLMHSVALQTPAAVCISPHPSLSTAAGCCDGEGADGRIVGVKELSAHSPAVSLHPFLASWQQFLHTSAMLCARSCAQPTAQGIAWGWDLCYAAVFELKNSQLQILMGII